MRPTGVFEVAHVPRTRPRRACSVEVIPLPVLATAGLGIDRAARAISGLGVFLIGEELVRQLPFLHQGLPRRMLLGRGRGCQFVDPRQGATLIPIIRLVRFKGHP